MNINSENYELYVIDYIDGTLTPSQEKELRGFLALNPHLAEELDGLEQTILQPTSQEYPNKHSVYKDTSYCGIDNRLDYLSIAKLEGDITAPESKELEKKLTQSNINAEGFALFQKAKLIPDTTITYAGKAKLKRYAFMGLTYRQLAASVGSVAAVVAILLGVSIFIPNKSEYSAQPVAITHQPKRENDYLVKPLVIKEPTLPIPKVEVKRLAQVKPLIMGSDVKVQKKVVVNLEPVQVEREATVQKLSSIGVNSISYNAVNHIGINSEELLAMVYNRSGSVNKTTSGTREVGVFELVQMGVNRLARLTEKNISLAKETDANGYIKRINFESPFFALSLPVKKDKEN